MMSLVMITSALVVGCTYMSQPPEKHSDNQPQKQPVDLESMSPAIRELLQKRYQSHQQMLADLRPGANQTSPVERVPGTAEIVGVYAVKAKEPCHLVELRVAGAVKGFDLGDFTQPVAGKGRSFWQVPWREVILSQDGAKVVADSTELWGHSDLLRGDVRLAFFFHYLDVHRQLESPFGDISLPEPSPKPKRLKMLKYEAPD
jgi:hypothetical protein